MKGSDADAPQVNTLVTAFLEPALPGPAHCLPAAGLRLALRVIGVLPSEPLTPRLAWMRQDGGEPIFEQLGVIDHPRLHEEPCDLLIAASPSHLPAGAYVLGLELASRHGTVGSLTVTAEVHELATLPVKSPVSPIQVRRFSLVELPAVEFDEDLRDGVRLICRPAQRQPCTPIHPQDAAQMTVAGGRLQRLLQPFEIPEASLIALRDSVAFGPSGLIDVDDSHAGLDLRVWAHERRR